MSCGYRYTVIRDWERYQTNKIRRLQTKESSKNGYHFVIFTDSDEKNVVFKHYEVEIIDNK